MGQKRLTARVREVEVENPRDNGMARLLAARVSLQAAIEAIDEIGVLFVNPADDKGGKKRREALEDALEASGSASRALEAAEVVFTDEMAAEDWRAPEPWEDDGEEGDEEDDEEEDEDEEDDE